MKVNCVRKPRGRERCWRLSRSGSRRPSQLWSLQGLFAVLIYVVGIVTRIATVNTTSFDPLAEMFEADAPVLGDEKPI
eukprot:3322766-Pyramimonas_sp.AAC.1